MRFDASRLLACGIAAGLAWSPLAAAPMQFLDVPICGSGGIAHIPVPGKQSPRPDCPLGCHAVAGRRCDAEDDPN